MTTSTGNPRRLRGIVVLILLGAALVALAVVVFRGGRHSGLPGCARYVPHDSAFLMMIPSIKEAMQQQTKLFARLKKNQIFGALWEQYGGLVVQEMGFDPGKPDSIKAMGVDPSGGAVAAMSADGQISMVALAVSNKQAMDKTLRGHVKRMTAQVKFETRDLGGVEVTVAAGRALAWGYHGSCVIISLGTADGKAAQHVARLAALKKNITGNKTFKSMLARVQGQQLLLYINGASLGRSYREHLKRRAEQGGEDNQGKKTAATKDDPAKDLSRYFAGGILGLGISGKQIEATAFVGMPGDRSKKLARLLRGKGKAPAMGQYILPDAITAARGSLDLKMIVAWMEAKLPADARQQYRLGVQTFEQRTGIKEQDLYGLLAGRYAVGIFAPSPAALRGMGAMRDRLARAAGGVLLVQVTDAKKAATVLERLATAWKARGADIQVDPKGGGKRYCYRQLGQCLLSWTVAKNLVVIASSRHLDASVKLVQGGGKSLMGKIKSSHARSTFRKAEGMIWYLDLYQVATLAKKITLPGFYMLTYKMYVQPASALLSMFSELACTVEPRTDGITSRLVITLK